MEPRTSFKILGREPSAWVAIIGPILVVIATLNVEFLNAGQAAAITAALAALVLVVTTRPVAPSLVTGVISAFVALFAEYQIHASEELVAALTGAALAILAFITREQVKPQETPITHR